MLNGAKTMMDVCFINNNININIHIDININIIINININININIIINININIININNYKWEEGGSWEGRGGEGRFCYNGFKRES